MNRDNVINLATTLSRRHLLLTAAVATLGVPATAIDDPVFAAPSGYKKVGPRALQWGEIRHEVVTFPVRFTATPTVILDVPGAIAVVEAIDLRSFRCRIYGLGEGARYSTAQWAAVGSCS